MAYDCLHYNNPAKGNKYKYAIGNWLGEPLDTCAIIQADNKRQAQEVLRTYNKQWSQRLVMTIWKKSEVEAEYSRREQE